MEQQKHAGAQEWQLFIHEGQILNLEIIISPEKHRKNYEDMIF